MEVLVLSVSSPVRMLQAVVNHHRRHRSDAKEHRIDTEF
jgi:hypothetical protein